MGIGIPPKARIAVAAALTVPVAAAAAIVGPKVVENVSGALHATHVFEGSLPAYRTLDPAVKLRAERAADGKTVELLPIEDGKGSKHEPVSVRVSGSLASLEGALRSEGWTKAENLSVISSIRTYGSLMNGLTGGHLSFKETNSPVSMMSVGGKPMVAAYEKNNDYHLGRDHLRIFDLGKDANGAPQWGLATTRDTAAAVRLLPFGSSHQVDHAIDGERDYVVHDLAESGHGHILDAAQGVPGRDYAGKVKREYRTDSKVYEVTVD